MHKIRSTLLRHLIKKLKTIALMDSHGPFDFPLVICSQSRSIYILLQPNWHIFKEQVPFYIYRERVTLILFPRRTMEIRARRSELSRAFTSNPITTLAFNSQATQNLCVQSLKITFHKEKPHNQMKNKIYRSNKTIILPCSCSCSCSCCRWEIGNGLVASETVTRSSRRSKPRNKHFFIEWMN